MVVGCAGCYVCVSVGCHPGEWADLPLRTHWGSSFVILHQSLLSVSSIPPDLRPCPTLSWPGFQSFLFGRRDAETVIWPGDAVVSQEVVDSSSLLLTQLFFTNPDLHLFFLSLISCMVFFIFCSLPILPYLSAISGHLPSLSHQGTKCLHPSLFP